MLNADGPLLHRFEIDGTIVFPSIPTGRQFAGAKRRMFDTYEILKKEIAKNPHYWVDKEKSYYSLYLKPIQVLHLYYLILFSVAPLLMMTRPTKTMLKWVNYLRRK